MGNRRLYKIERFHTLGTPESERLEVTALNLFHPTASPLLQKVGFFVLRHSLSRGRIILEDFDALRVLINRYLIGVIRDSWISLKISERRVSKWKGGRKVFLFW